MKEVWKEGRTDEGRMEGRKDRGRTREDNKKVKESVSPGARCLFKG